MLSDFTASREYSLVRPRVFARFAREFDDVREGWARIAFYYCGLCGSDMSKFEGRRTISYPASLGHEFIGQVVAVADDIEGLSVGDYVTSDLNFRCGTCLMCSSGRSHLCESGQVGMFTNRAFADYADIDARYLLRVEGPLRGQLALAEPLSCVLHAKRWADPAPGDRVLVVGAGGLGLCMSFALWSSPTPIAFDIVDRIVDRARLIQQAAAPYARHVEDLDGSYDVVFDLSGTAEGLRLACTAVRPGGRLCSMSHLEEGDAPFLLSALTRRDVEFKVSYLNGELENLGTAVQLLSARWDDDWQRTVTVVPLDALQNAFETRSTSPTCKTIVSLV